MTAVALIGLISTVAVLAWAVLMAPVIVQALAEKVREAMFTAESAREAIRDGMSVGEVDARDVALEHAARLIEEVEL